MKYKDNLKDFWSENYEELIASTKYLSHVSRYTAIDIVNYAYIRAERINYIKKWNPDRSSIETYIWQILQSSISSYFCSRYHRETEKINKSNSELFKFICYEEKTSEIKDFISWLKKTHAKSWRLYAVILNLMLKGFKQDDISKRLKIPQHKIHLKFKYIKSLYKTYTKVIERI